MFPRLTCSSENWARGGAADHLTQTWAEQFQGRPPQSAMILKVHIQNSHFNRRQVELGEGNDGNSLTFFSLTQFPHWNPSSPACPPSLPSPLPPSTVQPARLRGLQLFHCWALHHSLAGAALVCQPLDLPSFSPAQIMSLVTFFFSGAYAFWQMSWSTIGISI